MASSSADLLAGLLEADVPAARTRRLFRRTAPRMARPATPDRPGAVVSQAHLQQLNPLFDWMIVAALFAITTIGNVGLFGATITRLFERAYWHERELWIALALGIVMQIVVQLRQWATAHQRDGWRYLTALGFSVVPSIWTYAPIAVPWLIRREHWGSGPIFWVLSAGAFAVVVVGLIMVDVAQEWLVVKD